MNIAQIIEFYTVDVTNPLEENIEVATILFAVQDIVIIPIASQ